MVVRRSDISPNSFLDASSSESSATILSRTLLISSDVVLRDFSNSSILPLIWATCSLCAIPDELAFLISSSAARISSRTCLSFTRTSSRASRAFLSFSPSSASLSSDAGPNFNRFC